THSRWVPFSLAGRFGSVIMTIGHSTRSLDDFVELLRAHDVSVIVDVRRFPASRRHPHFASAPLARGLELRGIGYTHDEALGGRRAASPGSANTALRDPGFRGYADHMCSDGFRSALRQLVEAGGRASVAVMCAEAVPWRCHRWLLSDALVASGVAVEHIVGAGPRRAHHLNPMAVEQGGCITYPGQPSLPLQQRQG
ncbi:MAG: DUF488 family protein, partial [Actinomycetota bacterium]